MPADQAVVFNFGNELSEQVLFSLMRKFSVSYLVVKDIEYSYVFDGDYRKRFEGFVLDLLKRDVWGDPDSVVIVNYPVDVIYAVLLARLINNVVFYGLVLDNGEFRGLI